MSGPVDVHTLEEREGNRRAGMALQQQRFDATQDLLANRRAYDIADLSDSEFDAMLKRERVRLDRVKQIIRNDLVPGKDYGVLPGTDKPTGFEGAADKIAMRFRWTPRRIGEPSILREPGRLMVTLTVGIFNNLGQLVASADRSCSTREKRFRRKGQDKWKYEDPDECLNECVAMAFKRGKNAAIFSACGIKGEWGEEEVEEDTPETWTPEQKQVAYGLAPKAGIKAPEEFAAFVQETLGREAVYAVDVPKLMAALEAKVEARKQAKAAKAEKPEQDLVYDAKLTDA